MADGPGVNEGWHEQPDGSQRYWNGHKWVGETIPSSDPPPAITKARRRSRWWLTIPAVLLLAVGGGVAWLAATAMNYQTVEERYQAKWDRLDSEEQLIACEFFEPIPESELEAVEPLTEINSGTTVESKANEIAANAGVRVSSKEAFGLLEAVCADQ